MDFFYFIIRLNYGYFLIKKNVPQFMTNGRQSSVINLQSYQLYQLYFDLNLMYVTDFFMNQLYLLDDVFFNLLIFQCFDLILYIVYINFNFQTKLFSFYFSF